MTDATAEDLLSNWKRELKSAEVEGIGTVYYYDPPSVAERDAYYRHLRFEDGGGVSISLEGIVDGLVARLKKADSKPMFLKHHRSRLMEMPESRLLAIWRAVGGDDMRSVADLAESAEKK